MADESIKRGVYNCPNCGAAATPESVRCPFCSSTLATIVCSRCYGAIFIGMRHCPTCGAEAPQSGSAECAPGECPRCKKELLKLLLGIHTVLECPACGGLWVDRNTLQHICTHQEAQETVMGFDFAPQSSAGVQRDGQPRAYVPCPRCKKLMNRQQFAECSGVIVDWCRDHGTWFDRNELKQIVRFIQGGGMRKSREREKLKLEEARLHLCEQQRTLAAISRIGGTNVSLESPLGEDPDSLLQLISGIWRPLGEQR